MKIFTILAGIINAVCLVTVCLLTAVEIPTFNTGFYSMEYDRYNIPQSIRVEKSDLMRVTDHMLEYLKDREKDLVVYAKVDGVEREFFNDLEKSHMVDVKNLFIAGENIRLIALFGFLGTIFLMYFMKVDPLPVVCKANLWAATSVLILLFVSAVIIIMDFEHAFTIFHLIFFDNDMWILNPQTDLLINIVPLSFFMDISKTVALIFIGSLLLIIIASAMYLRYVAKASQDLDASEAKREAD